MTNILEKVRNKISRARRVEEGRQQPAEWYNRAYSIEAKAEYACHYTRSRYYFLWTVMADRIRSTASILEIGCGSGQFAHLIADKKVVNYLGFDFSEEAVKLARSRCPSVEFHVADGLTTDLVSRVNYDHLICTEVLEHIDEDLRLVSRIRPDVRCLMTVPNFPYVSHVRHFESSESVNARYSRFFSSLTVDWLLMSEDGKGFFLMDGIRTGTHW